MGTTIKTAILAVITGYAAMCHHIGGPLGVVAILSVFGGVYAIFVRPVSLGKMKIAGAACMSGFLYLLYAMIYPVVEKTYL